MYLSMREVVILACTLSLGTGSATLINVAQTATGAADGSSQVEGQRVFMSSTGDNNLTQVLASRQIAQHAGTGQVTLVRGSLGEGRLDGPGTAGTMIGASGQVSVSGDGYVEQAQVLRASSPEIGAGTIGIGAVEGLRVSDLGHPRVGAVYGVRVQDQSGTNGLIIGLRTELSAGNSHKYNIYQTGSAPNVLEALTIFGTDRGVRFENQKTGAAKFAAPPAFWLKVIINGTPYVVPAWRG